MQSFVEMVKSYRLFKHKLRGTLALLRLNTLIISFVFEILFLYAWNEQDVNWTWYVSWSCSITVKHISIYKKTNLYPNGHYEKCYSISSKFVSSKG